MHVCIVWFRSSHLSPEDPSSVLGIYTTRTLALQAARGAETSDEDEWTITETPLNATYGPNPAIWCRDADLNRCDVRKFYQRFWRAGYPVRPN
jgi:hypothetical protein